MERFTFSAFSLNDKVTKDENWNEVGIYINMNLIRFLHRWTGLIFGFLVLLPMMTGTMLVYAPQIQSMLKPELSNSHTILDHEMAGLVLDAIDLRYGDQGIFFLIFPKRGKDYFEVWKKDGHRLYIHPTDFHLIEDVDPSRSFFHLLSNFHTDFLLDYPGSLLLGLIGLTLGALASSGIIIWLRHRKVFSLKNIRPNSTSSTTFLRSHHSVGILFSVTLLLTAITGTCLVFSDEAKTIASFLDGSPPRPQKKQAATLDGQPALSWFKIAEQAHQAVPNGTITVAFFPDQKSEIKLTMRRPGDWHAEGGTEILVHQQTGEILRLEHVSDLGPANRFLNAVFALHTGRGLISLYSVIVLVTGLSGIWIVVSGLSSYLMRRKTTLRKAKRPQREH